MIEAICIMGGLGIVVGAGLAMASKIFYVYVDPKIVAVDDVLPGANCGGCGFPGCTANAEAIVAGTSAPNSCVAAGSEVAEAIAAIIGASVEAKEPDIAAPGCYFGVQDADTKYIYDGLSDCRAASLLSGGMKICTVGCLGLGSCVRACPFDAITMGPDNLPVVDAEKCTGCGTCERVCPKHIITLSSITRRILREYTDEECTTPCQRGCPAGIDIREYIRQIQLGDYHRAVQVIKERNPFPAVIGRICPRPCEDQCRRNMVDEPVAINFLKRFVADYEKESGERILPYKAPETHRKMAVVGGGVEGLSAAFFSARLGHDVSLFEASDKMGGLLRTAIAPERLSEEVLQWDIDGILEMGVTARTGITLGRDFSLDMLLRDGFESVLLTTGGWDSRLTRISGADIEEQIPGTFLLIDLIKSDSERSNRISPRSDVVIVGGGKVGLRAAKICWDLGSENITVLFRESREQLPKDALTDLEELENEKEIHIVYNASLSKIFGEDRQLKSVEYIDVNTRETATATAQNLFVAAGRFPEMIFTRPPVETDAEADETAETVQGPVSWVGTAPYKRPDLRDETGIFARGDVLTDYSAAIRAIAAGRRSAASVHRVMYGIPLDLEENVLTPASCIQDVDHVENVKPVPRQIMPLATPRELAETGVLEKGFTEQMAIEEADRCLQCGLICYERSAAPLDNDNDAA
ncbi:electron transporter RnfB [Desulfonema ishimotonii]|uniref:Ion-translocating oxidoreductase complex subunit B n=1 Tax=Desulfonema ishimotonii TaxID=45657 RepID=A0A401FRI1_9BACT|nr:FAD-dependent oxidoreductase [Desulfonema ishimotonii]GBC59565.1 electron transporter RnfB [Desulfonema ishimotonii]